MKLALLGHTGHYTYYDQVLKDLPGVRVVAVALSAPGESLAAFDAAPGVTARTKRYTDYEKMLDEASPDLVQVCTRPDCIPTLVERCLLRRMPVMTEKPLAMDLQTLSHLYALAKETQTPLAPLHGYRRMTCLAAVREAIRAGAIGEPVGSISQISYRWGKRRADFFRSRDTFPGIVPFIGIHIIDWLIWMMGDVFVEATGWESTTPHPDYPGCASLASFLLRMSNGGVATATLDFQRPASTRVHGDERVRVLGTEGIVESVAGEGTATLLDKHGEIRSLPIPEVENWYTAFVRSVRGEGRSFISLEEAFRMTEIALRVQHAIDQGTPVSLEESAYAVGPRS